MATRAVSALMKAIPVTGQIAGFTGPRVGTRVGHTGPGYPRTRVLTSLLVINLFTMLYVVMYMACDLWNVGRRPS